jgi:hypothetical protein
VARESIFFSRASILRRKSSRVMKIESQPVKIIRLAEAITRRMIFFT